MNTTMTPHTKQTFIGLFRLPAALAAALPAVFLLGGVLGIGLSLLVGWGFDKSGSSFTLVYSTLSMVAAFACSTLIGVIFGFLPANNAAKLNPIDALARE